MTVITVKMSGPIETFYFNPPLPPAKEIKILNFECLAPFSRRIILEIVDPFSSYSNFRNNINEPNRMKIDPDRMVAYAGCFSIPDDNYKWRFRIFCHEKFPTVKAKKSKDPINSMKINIESILDISIPDFYNTCSVCLKIYH